MRWKGMFFLSLSLSLSLCFSLLPPPPFTLSQLIKTRRFFSKQLKSSRPELGMDSKDAHESLESGGGGARCRCSNGRRTAAVFVIQSLLTAVCAAFSLNAFLNQQHQQQQQQLTQDKGIFMQMHELDYEFGELSFMPLWNHGVELTNGKTVKLSCPGPYMVYLWVCVSSYDNATVANLTLEQGEKSFHLQTLRNDECKEIQSVLMLSNETEITLKVGHIKETFSIQNLFLGLHYMLGAHCFHS